MFVDKRKYAERREYLINKVRERRKKTKELAVAYKGGRCFICGYNACIDALEFHHLEAYKKKFGIGKSGYTRRLMKVFRETDKCVLVCSNCHREIHAGMLQLPRETVVEKLGEFRESYGRNAMETVSKACGKRRSVRRNVQRLGDEDL